MTASEELPSAETLADIPCVFAPARAAEILRGAGLEEMTECALRTRAYRKQIPFHRNGNRIFFTTEDLREIARGVAYHPPTADTTVDQADHIAPPPRLVPSQPSQRPRSRSRAAAATTHEDGKWRARRPRNG
jgi:hypothetical protein